MSSQKILIKNGTVVHSDKVEVTDVLIEDQVIGRIGNNISVSVDREIDAASKLVLPGGIDSHCHIEQRSASGLVNSDTFLSGTTAAALGGNTTVIPFAAQYEGDSLTNIVQEYHELAENNAVVDYSMHMIIAGPSDDVIDFQLPKLIREGHSSIKIFMTYDRLRIDDNSIRRILDQAKQCGAMVSVLSLIHI